MYKRLKDPLYGYIDIEDDVMEKIVDTANFQRLRSIIQTSYSPLYASAVHNRFVHSIGVYYLGKLVTNSILEKLDAACKTEELVRYITVFRFACILHDVGHAPFSHTGEMFFLNKGSRDDLHKQLVTLTGDKELDKEISDKNYEAAPHELMSALVGLKVYNNLFKNNNEKSFFIRCITGYYYNESIDEDKSFLNCLISLLNSSIIDVDKLDYLIRDAYITGFDTVTIDYERLLSSIKLKKIDKVYECVYTKSAISVIENVVYAHDAERKWIQNHPIVQYEAYIVRHAIETINKKYSKNKLFSYEFLTVDGKKINSSFKVSLLSDSDMIFLMKNIKDDYLINEYFSRKDRRHPMWKSEAEYKAFFGNEVFDKVESEFEELSKYLNSVCKSEDINDDAISACAKDIESTVSMRDANTDIKKRDLLAETIKSKSKHLEFLNCLKDFATQQSIEFDFVIIKANQFNSGFGKIEFSKIKIEFDGLKNPCTFSDIINVPTPRKSDQDNFYYLFYRRRDKNVKIDLKGLASILGLLAFKESYKDI